MTTPSTTDWITAVSTAAAALFTFIAAIGAWYAYLIGRDTLRETRSEYTRQCQLDDMRYQPEIRISATERRNPPDDKPISFNFTLANPGTLPTKIFGGELTFATRPMPTTQQLMETVIHRGSSEEISLPVFQTWFALIGKSDDEWPERISLTVRYGHLYSQLASHEVKFECSVTRPWEGDMLGFRLTAFKTSVLKI